MLDAITAIGIVLIVISIFVFDYLIQDSMAEKLMTTTDPIRKYEIVRDICPIIGKPSPKVILALAKTLDDCTLLEVKAAAGTFTTSPCREALKELRRIGDYAVEQLIIALDDPNFKRIAASALHELTGQEFGEERKTWEEWWRNNKSFWGREK